MNFIDFLKNNTQQLNEMARSFPPKETGLKYELWIGSPESHGPRVKILFGYHSEDETASVKLNKDAEIPQSHKIPKKVKNRDVRHIKMCVMGNLEVLMDIHNEIMSGHPKATENIEDHTKRLKTIQQIVNGSH